MKKFKISKIMLIIGIIAVMCCISNISNASGDINKIIEDIPQLPSAGNGNNVIPEPTNNNVTTPINGVDDVNNTNATNTALPNLGAEDTVMWVLIGVCGLAAVYTYKKVRDYNI